MGGGEESADVAEHTGYRGEDTVAYRSTKVRVRSVRCSHRDLWGMVQPMRPPCPVA